MKIDVILGAGLSADQVDSLGRMADEYGINRLWGSHFPSRRDPWLSMAGLARTTRRIGLGTMPISPYEVHPLRIADTLLTFNELCSGRAAVLIGGLGHSVMRVTGLSPRHRLTAVRDCVRILTGIRDNLVVAVVSGTRRLSGWTAPQSLLADRLMPQLRMVGPAALIGMSNDVPSTSHIPRASTQARLALDFASFGERVVPYSSLSLKQLLVAQARDGMVSTLPAWLDAFASADERARGRLGDTLRAYADADMNVLRTAKRLDIHPNTIYARAQKIQDITGKNLLSYHDLTELLLATECRQDS